MNDTMDQTEGSGADESVRNIQKVDVAIARPIPGEDLYRITITKALSNLDVPAEEYENGSLLFRPEQGEESELIAHLITGETARDGRTNPNWRGIISLSEGTVFRITMRADMLESLGIDLDDGHPILNIWSGDGIVMFEAVDEKEVTFKKETEVLEQYGLTQREADTYRAVEIEDRTPAEVADELGFTASDEAETYKPEYYINQTVAEAKRKLKQAGVL